MFIASQFRQWFLAQLEKKTEKQKRPLDSYKFLWRNLNWNGYEIFWGEIKISIAKNKKKSRKLPRI